MTDEEWEKEMAEYRQELDELDEVKGKLSEAYSEMDDETAAENLAADYEAVYMHAQQSGVAIAPVKNKNNKNNK